MFQKINFLLLMILFISTACAQAVNNSGSSGSSLETECVLPDDQSGSLSGKWPSTPIPVAVQSSAFSDSEIGIIQAASQTWNDFYESSKGFSLLDTGQGESSQTRPSSICNKSITSGSSFHSPVVIYKYTSSWPYSSDVIALTTFCPISESPINRFYMSVMEINYEKFFGSDQKKPDLESILLHEFGHLIGLNHSCENFNKSGIPLCNGADNDYIEAVMFPAILFPNNINGEERRSLMKNDQQRANCLYSS